MSTFSRQANVTEITVLINTFFESQFSYFQLLCMFCGCTLNRKINRIRKRAPRFAQIDESSSKAHLIKGRSVTIHQRNVRVLAVEVNKGTCRLSPELYGTC